MSKGNLIGYETHFRTNIPLIVAKESGTQIGYDKDAVKNLTEEQKLKFPNEKFPIFEGNDGMFLFGPNAISFYLSNDVVRGDCPVKQAQIQQWVSFAEDELLSASVTWVYPCLGIIKYDKSKTEEAKKMMKTSLEFLNNHLLTRTYLVGERMTLADITVASHLLNVFKHVLDEEFRKPYGNVVRWFITIINQKSFKSVVGDIELAKEMKKFDAKKYAELHPSNAPKKETKKAKPAAPTTTTANVEEEEPKPKPKKDPFADIPKTNFNFDEFKRVYSNEDTLEVTIPYFWKNFDKANCSIWECTYKYPDELKKIFMTLNLVNGMFQRLETLRKNAFASMVILGENDDNIIKGIWIWRGQDLAFPLCTDWQTDYESYDWKKLDFNDEKTVSLINAYLAWEGEFDCDKKFADGKNYK
ncbi:hypothetical protein SNEBB_008760 [Seison nebaliae]|nr:hypothetical protein SNEBB_008760 [Seison nebaliae]